MFVFYSCLRQRRSGGYFLQIKQYMTNGSWGIEQRSTTCQRSGNAPKRSGGKIRRSRTRRARKRLRKSPTARSLNKQSKGEIENEETDICNCNRGDDERVLYRQSRFSRRGHEDLPVLRSKRRDGGKPKASTVKRNSVNRQSIFRQLTNEILSTDGD